MTIIPLGKGAYNRTYGQEPEIVLLNRFFEQNPTNQIEGFTLLSRPGSKLLISKGAGPIRMHEHQKGAFNGDLFFVSGTELYRYDGTTATLITGVVADNGNPSADFVVGAGYEHFFIADGVFLQYYDGEAAARGTLTASGVIIATETVMIDAAYYEWTAGSVDAGTPLGTFANPFLVALGADTEAALLNLKNALDLTGTAGTDYSTATQINANVTGFDATATVLTVKARVRGVGGNSIPVAETGANIAWADPTLTGGGVHSLSTVPTPDDRTFVSVATLGSYLLAVQSNSARFYWIQPGELTMDAFDFATAESEPDQLTQVMRIGDNVWMLGETSTEVWYLNSSLDPNASRFLRQQGLAFSQGILEGTAQQIRTQGVVVAEDGIVYEIVGGPRRISNNGIEERIRKSIAAQA
jgi:hypothetical protein